MHHAFPHPPPRRPVTGPPLASPIEVSVPTDQDEGQVTVISRTTEVRRDGKRHGWTPTGEAGAVLLGTATATLQSVHVRMPAEHRVSGVLGPAEVQLRYLADEGAQVAVAIPVVSGSRSAALDSLLAGILDVRGMLPNPRGFLAYQGTETIPPFQRPTMWLVSWTPISARTTQLARLLDHRPLPPRRPQPSQGRPVVSLGAKLLVLRDAADDADRAVSLS